MLKQNLSDQRLSSNKDLEMSFTSAAFPTSGNNINATNSLLILPVAVIPSILPTRNSAVKPVMTVTITSNVRAAVVMSFCVSTSSVLDDDDDELLLLLVELEVELLRERPERVVVSVCWCVRSDGSDGNDGKCGMRKTRWPCGALGPSAPAS